MVSKAFLLLEIFGFLYLLENWKWLIYAVFSPYCVTFVKLSPLLSKPYHIIIMTGHDVSGSLSPLQVYNSLIIDLQNMVYLYTHWVYNINVIKRDYRKAEIK